MPEESAQRKSGGNCPACGHQNGDWESRCQKCGRRLSAMRGVSRISAGAAAAVPARPTGAHEPARRSSPTIRIAPRPPAFPEHLRQQLQDRVQRYRTRRDNGSLPLPFEEPEPAGKILSFPSLAPPPTPETETVRAPASRPARESRADESVRAPAPQTALEFQSGSADERVWRLRAVAPLRRRWRGHLYDLGVLAGAMAFFLMPLLLVPYLGGGIAPGLTLLGGVLCGSLLLTLLYGLLFLWGAGVTPGMKAAGLRLANFDGLPASRQQRLWRLVGSRCRRHD